MIPRGLSQALEEVGAFVLIALSHLVSVALVLVALVGAVLTVLHFAGAGPI